MRGVEQLLYRDFDGNPVDEPSDVILAGLEDPRHEERVAPLVAIMRDEGSGPVDRLLACTALAGWGEQAGYAMVVESAGRPTSAPWYGFSIDRKFSADDSFSGFATAIDISDEISVSKQTSGARVEALRALIRIADTEYFDNKLDYAIGENDVAAVEADIAATVDRGLHRLSGGWRPKFDLLSQLFDLVAVLVEVREPEAVRLGHRLVELDASPRVLNHAIGIVTRGRTEESRNFGEYLKLVGDDRIREQVGEALDYRARIGSGTG